MGAKFSLMGHLKEILMYFRQGLPMLIIAVITSFIFATLFIILPPFGTIIIVIATLIFAGTAFGIAREALSD